MDELIEWLRAQIDTDDPLLSGRSPHWPDCQILKTPPEAFPFDTFSCNCGYPDQVITEVQAKRAILDLNIDDIGHCCPSCSDVEADNVHQLAIRLLAQSYARRPGWNEEWAVEA